MAHVKVMIFGWSLAAAAIIVPTAWWVAEPIKKALEPRGALMGQVLDDQGNPQADAEVFVLPLRGQSSDKVFTPTSEAAAKTTTDQEGKFSCELPAGKYWIAIMKKSPIRMMGHGALVPATIVHPGETLNLGSIQTEVKDMRPDFMRQHDHPPMPW